MCIPNQVNGAAEGYYTLEALLQDRAGNQTAPFMYRWFVDRTAPTTGNVIIPTVLTGGASTTFSSAVNDNLELGTTRFQFAYAGAGATHFIPFTAGESQADGDWDVTFTRTATATTNFPFVQTLGVSAPADAPPAALTKAAWAMVQTTDAAGNISAPAANNFVAASVGAGTAFAAGQTWQFSNAATNLGDQKSASPSCGAACVTSLTLKAVATGPTGTYVNPFLGGQIYIYHVADPTPAATYSGDELYTLLTTISGGSAGMTDDNINRFYTYSAAITGAQIAALNAAALPAAQQFVAIGVTSKGDAWHTLNFGNITLVAGK
jgi:hypothetical protein